MILPARGTARACWSNHAVPFLDGHVEHRAVRIDAGVAHGDGDGLQRPLRRREESLHRCLVPHVDGPGAGMLRRAVTPSKDRLRQRDGCA